MKMYAASVAFVYGPPMREHSSHIEFLAKDDRDAIESAARFARNREKAFEWTFAALKVGRFEPEVIAEDGMFQGSHRGSFFEWKYDWPDTLEQRIEDRIPEGRVSS